MGKRNKPQAKSAEPSSRQTTGEPPVAAIRPVHPPAKQPTLFAVSLILFALWFAFLLMTAVLG